MKPVIKDIQFYQNPLECGWVATIETIDGMYWVSLDGVIHKPCVEKADKPVGV